LSALGGGLEMYDFTLYMLFAPILAELFFPKEDPLAGLLGVFAIFAIGYLVRPIGGLILGQIGDVWGRKKTFIVPALLMAFSTVLIACLPTYQQLGVGATFLLVLLRIFQGLSVGGEIPGALVFSCEHIAPGRRGFAGGFLFMGINFGITLGALMSLGFHHFYSDEQLLHHLWRIPFVVGGLLGFVSFYLRHRVHESPVFARYLREEESHMKNRIPFLTLITYKIQVLKAFIITWMGALCIVGIYLYLPTYLKDVYSSADIALINFILLIAFSILIVFAGYWSDRHGRAYTLVIFSIMLLLCVYPAFALIHSGALGALLLGLVLLCISTAGITGIYPTLLTELFPVGIRYTGVAMSYNIGFALAGLAPLLTTLLKQCIPLAWASCLYLLIVTALAVLVLLRPLHQHY
jgi:MFS family permease